MSRTVDGDAYRALFDANPHPMWVFERETLRFLAVNDAAVRQYGYSREEFLKLTILDIRPKEDEGLVRDSIVPNLSVPEAWLHRRRDGSTLVAEITAHDIHFAGVDARLVLALDITVRERNAALIHRSNRTLEAVLRSAPVGVVVVLPNGQIGNRNDEAQRLLGSAGLALISPLVEAVKSGTMPQGAIVEVELQAGLWAEVQARPFEFDLNSNGVVVVLSDSTESRKHRTQLSAANEELETKIRERTVAFQTTDEELREFCFSVSHDLRSPLRAVDGFTQSVLSDSEANLSEDNRAALLRVRAAAKRMGELIDGLLMLSRIARAPMVPTEIDLAELARRIASDLKYSHPDRCLHFDIPEEAKVFGDPAMIRLMIECLFSNAVKFTSKREEAKIELLPDGDGWIVRDNGVGFDVAFGTKLFKPFERLHPNTLFPGNGLGLAVVYRIVRRHGGNIEGTGTPDGGATFRFSLPT